MAAVKRDGRCISCLRREHIIEKCHDETTCEQCGKLAHNTALCNRLPKPLQGAAISLPAGAAMALEARCHRSLARRMFSGIFTKTATVMINGGKGWRRAICYVDDGANISMVQTRAAEQASLPKVGEVSMALQAVGHLYDTAVYNVRKVRLRGTFPNAEVIEFDALERPHIANMNALHHTEFARQLWDNGYQLADDRFLNGDTAACEIEILIGANAIWKVCCDQHISDASGLLRAQESKIGWLLLGQDCSTTTTQLGMVAMAMKAHAWTVPESLSTPLTGKGATVSRSNVDLTLESKQRR